MTNNVFFEKKNDKKGVFIKILSLNVFSIYFI